MPKTPAVSGKKAVRVFKKLGFVEIRTKGSHVILEQEGNPYLLSVPVHKNEDLKKGTLNGLIKAANITLEEFIDVL